MPGQQALVVIVPVGGRFIDHHSALMREAKLDESSLADIGTQPARLFHIFIVSELGASQTLNHQIEFFPTQCPGIHGEKGRCRSFGKFNEVLPTVGIILRLPYYALHFFVVDIAVKATHAMAFDEGDHVVFEPSEVVGSGSHS